LTWENRFLRRRLEGLDLLIKEQIVRFLPRSLWRGAWVLEVPKWGWGYMMSGS
jgi:hypothetical protein